MVPLPPIHRVASDLTLGRQSLEQHSRAPVPPTLELVSVNSSTQCLSPRLYGKVLQWETQGKHLRDSRGYS